jgi:hypothetical protein
VQILPPYPRVESLTGYLTHLNAPNRHSICRLFRTNSALDDCLLSTSLEPQSRSEICGSSENSVANYLACVLILHGLQEPPTDNRIDPVGLRQRPLAPLFDVVR